MLYFLTKPINFILPKELQVNNSHLNITRQQVIPSFSKLRDASEYLAQIFVRVNLTKLATLDDGVNNTGTFCVQFVPTEQIVLSAHGMRAHRSLGFIVG